MSFIGCDVVDFELFKLFGSSERLTYQLRTFTAIERALADTTEKFAIFWAAKESSYKLFFKCLNLNSFSPALFQCQTITAIGTEGSAEKYQLTVKYKESYCYVMCSLSRIERSISAYACLEHEMLNQVELHAFYRVTEFTYDDYFFSRKCLEEIGFSKENESMNNTYHDHPLYGYPVLSNNSSQTYSDLSVSHDGRCVLVAMLRKSNNND